MGDCHNKAVLEAVTCAKDFVVENIVRAFAVDASQGAQEAALAVLRMFAAVSEWTGRSSAEKLRHVEVLCTRAVLRILDELIRPNQLDVPYDAEFVEELFQKVNAISGAMQ